MVATASCFMSTSGGEDPKKENCVQYSEPLCVLRCARSKISGEQLAVERGHTTCHMNLN